MRKLKFFIIGLLFVLCLLVCNKVQAANYSIDYIDMKVALKENGDLSVNEKLTYTFNGSYNGIYITLPYGVNDSKYDEIRKQTSLINDSFYNASSVIIDNVEVEGREYVQANYASNGKVGVYTVEDGKNIKKIKLYSPSSNQTKSFNISYTLTDVAVKHNDIGELYYNFIGGTWDKTIKKLNIDIKLPNNITKDDLYAFAHGPENGKVKIIDKNTINLYVEGIKSGEYVAGRVLFNLSNIEKSNKASNKLALDRIMQEEKNIYNKIEEKGKFNNGLLILAGGLLIYWLILILMFEKDKKYNIASNDEEMFEKYNPLLAGCIQGSRNVLSRDIIAVILDLVNKQYLEINIINQNPNRNINIKDKIKNYITGNNSDYFYYITKNEKSKYEPDEIEKFVVKWVLNTSKVNLEDRLKELPEEKHAKEKLEKLDELAMKRLNNLGANKVGVPWFNIINI